MLVENQLIKVTWCPTNIKWYVDLGYQFEYRKSFYVPVEHLPPQSGCKIQITCDYCETTFEKAYSHYVNWKNKSVIEKDCCKKCRYLKVKEVNLLTYGVENQFSREEIKQKTIEVNLDRYGVEYATQSDTIKEKTIITNLEKYGVSSPMKTPDIKNKANQTIFERYGVTNIMHLDSTKEKIKKTNLERYGYESILSDPQKRIEFEEENLMKYGVRHLAQTKEVQEKIKKTNLKKYGVESVLQNKEVRKKVSDTLMKKYGVTNPTLSPEIRQKVVETMSKNNTTPTSSQQKSIYKELKQRGYDVVLNHPFSRCIFDIALFIEGLIIDIEYDGAYFHQNQHKDRKRDEFVKSQGVKILRIKSSRTLPDYNEVEYKIKQLIDTDRKYTEIVLDDWYVNEKVLEGIK